MIEFKSVKFKNISSYGNKFVEFKLNEFKNVLFQGVSASGKSTFLSALSFCLFGKPFTNIKKNNLINSINNANLVTEVELTTRGKDFKIIRGMKPNIFEIYENGNLLTQEAATVDYQKILEQQILGFNYKTFLQIVLLGSANFVPFMQLPSGERRKIVEEVLDITSFSRMNDILKEDAARIRSTLSELEHKKSLLESEINLRLSYKKKDQEEKELRKAEIETELQSIKTERDQLLIEVKEVSTQYKKILEYSNKISSMIDKLTRTESTLKVQVISDSKNLTKQLEYFKSHNNCELCLQSIEHGHKNSIVEKVNNELLDIKKKYNTNLEIVKKKIKELKTAPQAKIVEEKEKSLKASLEVLKEKNLELSLKTQTLDSELKKLNIKEETPDLSEIKAKQKQLKQVLEDHKNLLEEQYICELAAKFLKDDGIKTDIILEYLPLINASINQYLLEMNFNVQFTFDENFKETIEARGKSDYEYYCFSEGEKQRLDLAILFTWRKIAQLKNSLNTNLLVIDEIADSHLSEGDAESVWKVMKTKEFEKSNIFVISHKNMVYEMFDKVYNFKKVGNFSEIS